jgi:hypothetical protein
MADYTCAFSATLMGGDFGCRHATPVVRRGGPDMACVSEEAQARCRDLFLRMKEAALPAFGVEDDLLTMPHSVLVKVQFGGLAALQHLVSSKEGQSAGEVEDIAAVVEQVRHSYGELDKLPYGDLVEGMVSHKLRRRRSP